MTLCTRLARLEAAHEEAVERFQHQPWAVRRRVLDACAERLIALGHLPPVDPAHPDIPLETHRTNHPEAFRAWHAATFASEAAFVACHGALIPAFFAALREEMPHGTP